MYLLWVGPDASAQYIITIFVDLKSRKWNGNYFVSFYFCPKCGVLMTVGECGLSIESALTKVYYKTLNDIYS